MAALLLGAAAPGGPAVAAGAGALAEVPTRGCPLHGQAEDRAPPRLVPRIALAVPAGAAGRLAFYRSVAPVGVLAPRGWTCAAFDGSTGLTLMVAPPGTDLAGNAPLKGPAVVRQLVTGGTSGRFEVAEVAARAFPAFGAFAHKVAAEGTDDRIVFSPYPRDRLTAAAAGAVVFSTPAETEGLGTLTLAPDRSPITGFARLDHRSDGPDLTYLAIRLGPAETGLAPAILAEALAHRPNGAAP